MSDISEMNVPLTVRRGSVLRCTGRILQPDKLLIRVETIDWDDRFVVAMDLNTRQRVDLTLHRGGTGHFLLIYRSWTFGRIEVLLEGETAVAKSV